MSLLRLVSNLWPTNAAQAASKTDAHDADKLASGNRAVHIRLQDFLTRFGSHFCARMWHECPPSRSPAPEPLKCFWQFFRRKRVAARCLARLLDECCPKQNIAPGELPDVLMLLELLLVNGEYGNCATRCEKHSSAFPADLRLQDIRARAIILGKDDSPLESNLEYGWKPFARYFCSSTFDTLAFFEREVYVCCVNYIPTSIGRITASSASELWDGEVAQSIRGAILDGSYRYCHKMVCPRLRNNDLPLRTEATLSPYYKNIIARGITASPECYPRSVELNEDPSCNLVCPSCRAGPEGRDTETLQRFERDVIPGVLRNELNSFLVACYGDPFSSSHYLRVLRALDPAQHAIKELVLYTNGTRFTPAQWQSLSNLHAYPLIEVRISVDAATPETYALIRPRLRGPGDFSALLINLEFVSSLRRSCVIKRFKLFFVVQYDNFREISAFVQLGKQLGADEIVFSEMQKFGVYLRNDSLYVSKAIHIATHPEHMAYKAILEDPVLRDPAVSFHGCRLKPSSAVQS